MFLLKLKSKISSIFKSARNCNHNLVEIKLKGGFGNQLFQFATGVSFALDKKSDIYFHDLPPITNDPLNVFGLGQIGISPGVIYKIENKYESLKFNETSEKCLCMGHLYKEKNFSFEEIITSKNHIVLDGYFQSYKYFEKHRASLLKYLREKLEIRQAQDESNFVIQVRLGDLLTNPKASSIHGVIPEEFINKVINISNEMNLTPFVITDDVYNASRVYPVLDKRKDILIHGGSAADDFRRMARAKNLAISNSTFGWWAAWIGFATIYAPRQWFVDNHRMGFKEKDYFPEDWLVL
jgi:hypothetical protein